MLGFDAEKRKVEEAIQQAYRDFALKYGEIQKSDLSAEEKLEQINNLIETTSNKIKILRSTRSLSELSEDDKEALEIKEVEHIVDENVVNTLVEIYAKRAKIPVIQNRNVNIYSAINLDENETLEDIDTTAFEEELRQYFTEHYSDLLSNGFNDFLSEITEIPDEIGILHKKYGDLTQMAKKYNIDPEKFKCFGHQLTVQDGFVAEEESIIGKSNVFYASPEGINKRIYDLYSKALFDEQTSRGMRVPDENRKLKNSYITYAEKNGIAIEDRAVFEELPVDMDKVRAIANYVNRVLNERKITTTNLTDELIEEIQKDYSKIMNLNSFNFGDLETVKRETNNKYESIYLSINEDSILKTEMNRPDIAYATPEYIRNEYKIVMAKIRDLSYCDAFSDGKVNLEVGNANREKEALRRYITENGIEGIDISIPDVDIDHKKTGMIADALINIYGKDYEDKEGMRARILKKVEDRYPELVSERQVINLDELIEDELKDMGRNFVMSELYVKEDFIYVGEYTGRDSCCIYATPKAISEKIELLDDKISKDSFSSDSKRIRSQLEQYAKDNNLGIEIPSIESAENKRRREEDIFSFRGGFFGKTEIPDDPTARPKIELEDTMFDAIYKMSEGLPGALVAIKELMNADENGFFLLLNLDDMNIRGSQIWQAYKYLCNEDGKEFVETISNRSEEMVNFINEELASVGGEKAVRFGASFDRNKNPDKYRFTEAEVEQLREQKEDRISREKERREKMLANSPAKKNRGAKKREEREAKRKAYRERLIANGRKSIKDLDEELTGLKGKEEEARKLCQEYEEQIPEKNIQEF